jgi:nucleoside-diphosphate-sugar epimerase
MTTTSAAPALATRTALVLGATGGIGGETAAALARRGWRVRALVRDPDGAAAARRRAEHPDWEFVAGDAMDPARVADAAAGAAAIVHAVNPPGYRDWERLVLPMIDHAVAAARASGARILLPGTLYNYDPADGPLLREDAPQRATTRKGRIRIALERRLQEAAATGVRSLIVRFGDFFGPRPGNAWFSQAMVTPGRPVARVVNPGRRGVGHAWAYLPDAGEAFARLADREGELEPFARFHFAGHWDPDGRAMTAAVARAVGNPRLPVWPLPWPLLRLAAPFNPTARELLEVRPFWRSPVGLDNRRLVAALGFEPRTPLDAAVAATLRGLGCLPAVGAEPALAADPGRPATAAPHGDARV